MASFIAFPEQLNMLARLGLAFGVLCVLFVLNVVAIPYPLVGSVKAPFFLMAIFYWAIFRPTLVPLWLVFLAGCLMDLLGYTPFGFHALIFVLSQWFIASQRRLFMAQPFITVWFGFSMLYGFLLFLQWLIMGLVQVNWLPVYDLGALLFFAVALFPPVYVILHLTHKLLPVPRAVMR